MNILITGATGFLGKNLVNFLSSADHTNTITAIGRDVNKLENIFSSNSILKVETDYSVENLSNLLSGIDIVIHLASQLMQRDTDPLKISSFDFNMQVIENLIIACEKNHVQKFINTSSISVYPLGSELTELQTPAPWNIYGVSKANVDIYLNYIQNKVNTKIVSLRLARLYGCGEREGLMFTDFINKARNKETLHINGDGGATIEYLYIEDAIEIINMFIQDLNISGTFNIGTGKAYSVKEIAESINEVFDNVNNIKYHLDRPSGLTGSVMNVSKTKQRILWEAKWELVASILDIKMKLENE